MAETVQININGKDNFTPVAKKVAVNLKQMGAEISGIGMRMSAAFTLPVVALGKMILQNEKVAASLKPVTDGLTQVKNDLALAFVPIIQQAMPALLNMVEILKQGVTWFANLDAGTKNNILTFIGVVAALGPAVVMFGQIVTVIGSVQAILTSMGVVVTGIGSLFTAVLIPVGAFVAAILLLGKVISDNWPDIQKAAAVAIFAVTGKLPDWAFSIKATDPNALLSVANWQGRAAGGDVFPGRGYMVGERGPEPFIPRTAGTILPTGALGSTTINFTYSPAVSLASKAEAENTITPVIMSILHKRGMR